MIICRLNYFLLLNKVTIDELSSELNIPKATLVRLKNCRSEIVSIKVLDSLCRYFKVTPGHLFEYIPEFKVEEGEAMRLQCNLKYLIAKSGMTQSAFAKRIHYSTATINSLIMGRVERVSVELIDTICRELNTTPGELFEYVKVKE